ncbi:Phr family secreted Rap phosphatase inhibitor [Bacillus clarus]|uniref:Phr family secreted Rap phosphatase inhibitor n=1 Tax=Bacillus clarus TaxID=2338372 RepID=A0A090YAA2_9BACI|nr:Phr family secreted Rap phosphatase inhibitor [Bacillus clarus]KFM95703.1 hypothetical protein DJ93_5528 [Bacillus clarus]RFT64341.1 Phr family secreted Rap phosphatase inhibitor [Bacillus clarus]
MKKTVFSLIGLVTVLTLMFGAQSPVETQTAAEVVQYAHGNHGG